MYLTLRIYKESGNTMLKINSGPYELYPKLLVSPLIMPITPLYNPLYNPFKEFRLWLIVFDRHGKAMGKGPIGSQ